MRGYTILPKKYFYLIFIPIGILIFIMSIEVIIKVKDRTLFDAWVLNNNFGSNHTESQLFNIYMTGNLALYFQKIIIPIGLSLHTYFSYVKIRINKLFVLVWTILLAGSYAYVFFDADFTDIFIYIYTILYIFIIFIVLSLIIVIDKSEDCERR